MAGNWVAQPLTSERPLIVYVDFKSPYAYLAIEPTRELGRELGIQIDWRPLVLDIPSFLGSARLGKTGEVVEQQRSVEQWSGVKYAYFDCRRYANLRGITIRGTVKIWDTNLAAVGMLWAKMHGDAILDRYLDGIFVPFWKRELDVEDIGVIRSVLRQAGAELAGFDDYLSSTGPQDNQSLQQAAFAAGIFGVPSYVVAEQVYFGREHLPRVAWHLSGESAAAPDVSYAIGPLAALAESARETLDVCVDFGSPLSYLAIGPTLRLAQETGVALTWHSTQHPALRPPTAHEGDDRGARHRKLRAANLARDIERYAPQPLADIYASFDNSPAAMGLLWLGRNAPAMVDNYMQAVFARYWRDQQAIDQYRDIVEVMHALGTPITGFADYVDGAGMAEVRQAWHGLQAKGVTGTPTFLIDDERFLGRQHLPLIRQRLGMARTI